MPHVTAATAVPAPLEGVRAVLAEPGRWAARADHVVAVTPTPPGAARWEVLLNGSRCSWTQTERADGPDRWVFEQGAGDLEQLAGVWVLEPADGGTRVTLQLAVTLGVDGLAPLLDPIWTQSLQAHADALVAALAAASLEIAEPSR
jgi:Polyketide cyclase / dehydrase and lipid transport